MSETYDTYEDAKFKLNEHLLEAEQIKRGSRLPSPPKKTFGDLCEYWLAKQAIRKRSHRSDASMIQQGVLKCERQPSNWIHQVPRIRKPRIRTSRIALGRY